MFVQWLLALIAFVASIVSGAADESPSPVPTNVVAVTPTPYVQADGIHGYATYYGISYQGLPLGCVGAGLYDTNNPQIAAVGPARYGEWPCGTRLELCGPGGCAIVTRLDSCPGCGPNVIDLSESANRLVCATAAIPYEHTCEVTIRRVQ